MVDGRTNEQLEVIGRDVFNSARCPRSSARSGPPGPDPRPDPLPSEPRRPVHGVAGVGPARRPARVGVVLDEAYKSEGGGMEEDEEEQRRYTEKINESECRVEDLNGKVETRVHRI